MSEHPIRIDFRDPQVLRLVAQLEAELHELYGRPDQDAPPPDAFDNGAFLAIREDGAVVACGGLRIVEVGGVAVGELKRMFTVPAARGRGHARALLLALTDVATELGVQRLILETGVRQPAAVALYESAGFVQVPCFGPYVGEPDSLCLERRLPGR